MHVRRFYLIILFSFLTFFGSAQISISDGGTVSIGCGVAYSFTDANPGGAYGPNEFHQITICADDGNAVIVDISVEAGNMFDIAEGDFLAIYDGPDTGAPLIGMYNSALNPDGIIIYSSIENQSACVTVVFTSDDQDHGQGFEGVVSCGIGWQPFSIEMSSDPADGENLPGYIDICPGETVDFSVTGDYPFSSNDGTGYEQSDDLLYYRWNMGDGTINEGVGLNAVSHTYDEQFGYNVTVKATDELGQFRTDTLKVRVSTTPDYQSVIPEENPFCLGTSTVIVGGYIDEDNYAGFEPTLGSFFVGGISAGQLALPDAVSSANPGVYTDTLFIAGMVPGATVSDPSDIPAICLNIEHSFLGDLEIAIQCPNGTTIPLVDAYNVGMFPGGCGGGGTYLGDANDGPLGSGPGIGFDYCFSEAAEWGTMCEELAAGNTVPVNTFQNGNAMAPGTYTPHASFDALVGCPVEGPWVVIVQDNLAADDGYIFEWSVQLNPDFFPDPEIYTPQIIDAYWNPSPSIINDMGLSIEVQPETAGNHSYEFVIVDDFGCQYDTTVTVLAVAPPEVEAGDNIFLACSDAQLNGLIDGQQQPQCSQDGGEYTYCYGNNENTVFTYCPDNPGDGITFLTLDIITGTLEVGWDYFTIYDGPNVGSPILAADLTGNLAGQSFTATNNGCLTILFESDGSVSCQSGSQTPMEYAISCTAGPQYQFSWEPENFLDDPNVLNPNVEGLTVDQVFTLTAFPILAPQCVVSDDVLVSLGEAPSPGEDSEISFCPDGPLEDLVLYLGGAPDEGGIWLAPDGSEVSGTFDPTQDEPGIYIYAIPGCDVEAELEVSVPQYAIELEPDTTICQNGSANLVVANQEADVSYQWSTGQTGESIEVSPLQTTIYTVTATFGPACTTEPAEVTVEVLSALQQTIAPGGVICPGDSMEVAVQSASGGLEPYTFTWTSDYGDVIVTESAFVIPEGDGNWCSTMTDACESTPAVSCVFIGLAEEIDPTFTTDTLGGCVPVSVFFQGNQVNTDLIESALWEFGNGTTSTSHSSTIGTYNVQGVYTVTYTAVSTDGCLFTHTEEDLLTIYNQPFAGFTMNPQTIVLPNTQADFTNQSLGSTDFIWVMNQTDSLFDADISYNFPDQTGIYPVTLYATNPWGCLDSLTRQVLVIDEFTMFVPNAFTPDNDGINDVWRFEGIDVDEDHFELLIFNRWGEVIHRTNEFKAGWNGAYNNGTHYVPDGIYLYRIETRSKTTQDNKVVSGHILITR